MVGTTIVIENNFMKLLWFIFRQCAFNKSDCMMHWVLRKKLTKWLLLQNQLYKLSMGEFFEYHVANPHMSPGESFWRAHWGLLRPPKTFLTFLLRFFGGDSEDFWMLISAIMKNFVSTWRYITRMHTRSFIIRIHTRNYIIRIHTWKYIIRIRTRLYTVNPFS